MSLAHHKSNSVTCAYCDGERDPFDSVEGSYCAKLCYFKHKGDKLLNLLRHDHTQCAMCGATLKTIEEPTDEALRQIDGYHSTTSVCGYQYRTPEADTGAKDITSECGERVVTGVVCGECGNTNISDEFPEMQDRFLFEYAEGIVTALEDKQAEHNKEISRETFFEMLISTEDIAFSLGKAIDG